MKLFLHAKIPQKQYCDRENLSVLGEMGKFQTKVKD